MKKITFNKVKIITVAKVGSANFLLLNKIISNVNAKNE